MLHPQSMSSSAAPGGTAQPLTKTPSIPGVLASVFGGDSGNCIRVDIAPAARMRGQHEKNAATRFGRDRPVVVEMSAMSHINRWEEGVIELKEWRNPWTRIQPRAETGSNTKI